MPGGPAGRGRWIGKHRAVWWVALAAAAVVVAALVVVRSSAGGDDEAGAGPGGLASAESSERPEPALDTDAAVWPAVSGAQRFADPVTAVTTFAVGFVGFVDPVVGEFRPVDDRSGEVPVRDHLGGPITTVQVRRLAPDQSWWVVGATSTILAVDAPAAGDTIDSPFSIAGQSAAFKPTVDVQLRQDGDDVPLGERTVEGGANNQMAPFAATMTYPEADVRRGTLVLTKVSATDGNVAAAAVVRVRFADVASLHPAWDNTGGVGGAAGDDAGSGRGSGRGPAHGGG